VSTVKSCLKLSTLTKWSVEMLAAVKDKTPSDV
jgi:hypothetical protein